MRSVRDRASKAIVPGMILEDVLIQYSFSCVLFPGETLPQSFDPNMKYTLDNILNHSELGGSYTAAATAAATSSSVFSSYSLCAGYGGNNPDIGTTATAASTTSNIGRESHTYHGPPFKYIGHVFADPNADRYSNMSICNYSTVSVVIQGHANKWLRGQGVDPDCIPLHGKNTKPSKHKQAYAKAQAWEGKGEDEDKDNDQEKIDISSWPWPVDPVYDNMLYPVGCLCEILECPSSFSSSSSSSSSSSNQFGRDNITLICKGGYRFQILKVEYIRPYPSYSYTRATVRVLGDIIGTPYSHHPSSSHVQLQPYQLHMPYWLRSKLNPSMLARQAWELYYSLYYKSSGKSKWDPNVPWGMLSEHSQEVQAQSSPTAFSWHLCRSLVLQPANRQLSLETEDTVTRLLECIAILKKYDEQNSSIMCQNCEQDLCLQSDVFTVPGTCGQVGNYINPHGHVHQTVTVRALQTTRTRAFGPPVEADSWFEGYAWTILTCVCRAHLGWLFTEVTPAMSTSTSVNANGNDNSNAIVNRIIVPPVGHVQHFYGLRQEAIKSNPVVTPARYQQPLMEGVEEDQEDIWGELGDFMNGNEDEDDSENEYGMENYEELVWEDQDEEEDQDEDEEEEEEEGSLQEAYYATLRRLWQYSEFSHRIAENEEKINEENILVELTTGVDEGEDGERIERVDEGEDGERIGRDDEGEDGERIERDDEGEDGERIERVDDEDGKNDDEEEDNEMEEEEV